MLLTVLDGRTLVVESSSNVKITLQLQYIEVPEPGQLLEQTVKDHLRKLTYGKTVNFSANRFYNSRTVGQVFLGDIDLSRQMLRDGGAWYALPDKDSHDALTRDLYLETENQASAEKRGIWGVTGLIPSWQYRAEKVTTEKARDDETKRLAAEEELKRLQESRNRAVARSVAITKVQYAILPGGMPNASFIDFDVATPKGLIVVGVGHRENIPEKVFKLIKKPVEGDIACSDFDLPSTFVASMIAYSRICARTGYGNNANYITSAEGYSRSVVKDGIQKAALAFRMYRVSGNYEEFDVKARSAIDAVNNALPFIKEDDIGSNLMSASEALSDAMLVRSSRSGNFGARLSGSALLALNDKYGLNDVSASFLDDKIIDVGIRYLNRASEHAARLGIVKLK